jgi:GH24 family phage-related lysozyme (muramidase)
MAFNMGVSGLRKTQTINAIKNGEYKKAGEFIKSENISSKFEKGLEKRRKEESEMFLSYLN